MDAPSTQQTFPSVAGHPTHLGSRQMGQLARSKSQFACCDGLPRTDT